MELVPIITQILLIVAAVFILVLIVSYGASRIKKKENSIQQNPINIQRVNRFQSAQASAGKNQYYGSSYMSGGNYNAGYDYPREIKVVKKSGVSKGYQTSGNKTGYGSYSNSRFTVLNPAVEKKSNEIVTDEFGFKVYSDNEISRSFYLPS